MSEVPCNGCRACCQNFPAILLHPDEGDDPALYDTVEMTHPLTMGSALMIKHKENGDCIYLGDNGCMVYDKRPVICQSFDCRINYLSWTKKRRERLGHPHIFAAARKRLHTLTGEERLAAIQKRKRSLDT